MAARKTAAKGSTTTIDIGIKDADRAKIARGLSEFLADSYAVYLMTHNFHWNVTGPQFNSLHAMFMDQYTEQWAAIDLIAERIRSLGFPAPGTYAEFAKLASIAEVQGVPKAEDMVRHLVAAQEEQDAQAHRRPGRGELHGELRWLRCAVYQDEPLPRRALGQGDARGPGRRGAAKGRPPARGHRRIAQPPIRHSPGPLPPAPAPARRCARSARPAGHAPRPAR